MEIQLKDWQESIYQEASRQLKTVGQAAIELFTSGGKTYIAGKIIQDYINDNPKKARILWISSRSAVDNVQSGYFDGALSQHIDFVTFTAMEKYQAENHRILGYPNYRYDLIVIDEAHRALAYYCYQGICNLRQEYSAAHILVMTATPKRYGDGRNAFEELTPKATPCGIPLREAVKQNLVTRMHYKICTTQLLKQDYEAILEYRRISEKYGIFRTQVDTLEQFLAEYHFTLKESALNALKANNSYDGSDGDRWMVFFPTILSLQQMKPQIYEAFSGAYPGKRVNILEYHGKNVTGESGSNNAKTLKTMTTNPEPNTVDIILTVEKGGESVHPKNIRGILMYRCTRSDRIYQQQLGRAIRIKEESSDPRGVIILDFVNNASIVGGDSLGIGYRGLTSRPDKSNQIDSVEDIAERVQRIDKDNQSIEVSIGDPVLAEYLELSKSMREMMPWMVMWDKVSDIMERATKYESFYDALKRNETYTLSEKRMLTRWYKDNQQKYMSGDFDNFEPDKKAYFDIMGCQSYMTPQMELASKKHLYILEKVAGCLDDIDYNYDRLDEIEGLRATINKFRSLCAAEKLASAEVIYCRRNGIDVELEEDLSEQDIGNLLRCRNSSRLVRIYTKVMSNVKARRASKAPVTFEDFTDIHAALLTFKRSQSHTLGTALYNKLMKDCEAEVSAYQVDPTDMEKALTMLEILDKAKNNQPLTVFDEDEIFQGVDNFEMAFKPFSRRMLELHGVNKYTYVKQLLNKTPWMKAYNKVLMSRDTGAYMTVKQYNPQAVPPRLQKLLRGRKFKQVETEMGTEIDNEIVKGLVKKILSYAEAVIPDLASRTQSGFPLARTLSYAFPAYAEKEAYAAFSGEPLKKEEIDKLVAAINSSTSVTKKILSLLSRQSFVAKSPEAEVIKLLFNN